MTAMDSMQCIIFKCQSQSIDAAWTEMGCGSKFSYDIDTVTSTWWQQDTWVLSSRYVLRGKLMVNII